MLFLTNVYFDKAIFQIVRVAISVEAEHGAVQLAVAISTAELVALVAVHVTVRVAIIVGYAALTFNQKVLPAEDDVRYNMRYAHRNHCQSNKK